LMRVVAFCEGDLATQALNSGAVKAGGEELVTEILKNEWSDFDVAIAHPSMMRFVGKLGKVLGPKGLMPSPKSGTVTPNVLDAVKEFKAGKLEFRHDKSGNLQVCVGKLSFEPAKLVENVESFINHVISLRPPSVRGRFMTQIVLTSTMGPGLKIEYGPAAAV
jgi:large subunit ribosomal protein L1